MEKLNIVADPNIVGVEAFFGDYARVQLVEGRSLTSTDLRSADALLVRSVTSVNEALLSGSPVRFVGTATSGFDHIDHSYLARRNIGFCHAPGSNANSVIEYVLAAIASSTGKLEQLLAGGNLGVIGYGYIGRGLAARCAALGIACKVYDPWLEAELLNNGASLSEVLACEVISLHAELTDRTPWPSRALLGERELVQVPSQTLLINASRGEIVSSAALRRRFEQGGGPKTVLDVWENEPDIPGELLDLVSLGTAHIAGYSLDGKYLATSMLREALMQYFELKTDQKFVEPEPPAVLLVPETLHGADLIRWAVTSRYDIREDDRLLRDVRRKIDISEIGRGFDQLRKSYRVRRELSGSRLQIHKGATAQAEVLAALGCIPEVAT